VIDVLTQDELARIIAACKGFPRDEALVRVLFDAGIRRSECAAITLDELDLAARRVLVHGKGNKDRWAPLGARTVLALRRYLRARARHPKAHLDALWLGQRGQMTDSAIYRVVKSRAALAGIEMHPHMLRHTWAHEFRLSGGQLDDLCQLAGWTTMNMALRYGASAAAERAAKSARKRSLGDKI
jgi:site-specific recombinase XerD